MSDPKFIVVIGTSAGGIRAIEELIMQLDPEMDAAFFIVLHLSRKGISELLFHRIAGMSQLPCRIASNKEKIIKGHIYLAPPDEHLLLAENEVVIGKGAQENRWRPSINNLFRSAAAAYNSRVIGIILTGLLDDGTSGMASIKRVGGITIVQDPEEADHPDMPLSVIENIEVDHIHSLSKMGELLREFISGQAPEPVEVPYDIQQESLIDRRVSTRISDLAQFEKIEINCPDCGGGLWQTQKEHPAHYRCHVGHSYTDRELLIRMSEVMENTFWTSLRMMEERKTLLMRLHKKDKERGYESTANSHLKKADELEVHIQNLKQILFESTKVD